MFCLKVVMLPLYKNWHKKKCYLKVDCIKLKIYIVNITRATKGGKNKTDIYS